MQRDVMSYDVLIVGAGPSGLSAAIRIKQLAPQATVCVLEKGAQVGTHILTGAILDPRGLEELIPDWAEKRAPISDAVSDDRFSILSASSAWRVPQALLPPLMRNHGNYIVSLGNLVRWLADEAETLGVEIYAGFAAQEILYGAAGEVQGVVTGDMGRLKNGEPGPRFTAGIEIHAAYTLIAEGARGSLTRALETRFDLRRASGPQVYGLGFKELWRVDPAYHRPGLVEHTVGWPLSADTAGGSFLYHYGENLVAVGFVIHLDYRNPYLSPFDEFQRFKTHPAVAPVFDGATRLSYGARALAEGGLQAWPQMVFPGGALMGCSAGMVNLPRIKGIHNAMKSGMLAAESVATALAAGRAHDELADYPSALRASWVYRDLDPVRNVKPWVGRFGTMAGSLFGGVEMWLSALGMRTPWTLPHRKADHERLRPARDMPRIEYPCPDGVLTFDRLSSVALSNIAHDDSQPCHLQLRDDTIPIAVNLVNYAAPETRYCPAGVYEVLQEPKGPVLRINASNCIHCKTCDIKDPMQNIIWTPPEGSSGPTYSGM